MKISITIPVYNDLDGLIISLNSIIKQRYDDWEVVVVDDGSLLDCKPMIDKIIDSSKLKYHSFEKNLGRPFAREKCFDIASGDLIAFLDAGDVYSSDFLMNAVNEFNAVNVGIVSQSMTIKYGNTVFYSNYQYFKGPISSSFFDNICFASTVIRKELCIDPVFNKSLRYSQDKDFLNQIRKKNDCEFVLLNTYAYIYNQGQNMKLSVTVKKYYYDFVRVLNDKDFTNSFRCIAKLFFMPLLQLLFGYEFLLKLRFKKDKKL